VSFSELENDTLNQAELNEIKVVNCAFESQRRLYLNVNLMTALNYKTWMVQTLKLN
jgi:hypothetical protein